MKTTTALVVCLLALTLIFTLAGVAQGPADAAPVMFHADARHTGVYPASKAPQGKLKWSFQTGKRVRSGPAFYNGAIFFGSDDGHLYALDAQTGKLKWKYLAAGAVSSSPAVYRNLVYIQAGDTAFHAVDAATGREKWTVRTGKPISSSSKVSAHDQWEFEYSSPVISGNTVYCGSADGSVYALDPASGKQKWVFKTGGRVRSSPAAADGVLYVGSMDGNLYALDAATGALKWKFKTKGNQYFPLGEVQSPPAVGDGLVYFGARDGALYAVNLADGTEKWKVDQDNFSWIIGGPALYKDMVIVTTSDAKDVKAYDAKTGQLKWKAASPEASNIMAAPTIAGDTLYFGDFYGAVLWLNAGTGKLLGGWATDSRIVSSPIVHDGVLYVGSEDDYFYALE